MLRLLGHRLLWSVPVVFVATALSFALTALVPGNAARAIVGPLAPQSQEDALRVTLGLDKPLPVQYGHWLGGAVHGDLGKSLFSGQSVTVELNQHLEVTLSLLILGTIVSALIGLTIGVIAALRGGFIKRLINAFSLAGLAIPNFWLALILTALFAVTFRIFPVVGYVSIFASPGQWARSLVLPVLSLSLGSSTIIAKQTYDSLSQVLGQDYIRTLRANGLARSSILWRHALRNAGVPVLTVIGVVFVSLISGSILIEQVFAMPGLGSMAVSATTQHDLPLIQGVVVYFTLLVVLSNLLIDLSYGALDARVRVR